MGQQVPAFESLEIYQLAERLASMVWSVVDQWNTFARDTVGKQWVRAADSIGANLAEGYGRGTYTDNKRFVHIARGSLNETICWLTRATTRRLVLAPVAESIRALLNELGPRLNAYLSYINRQIRSRGQPGKPPAKG